MTWTDEEYEFISDMYKKFPKVPELIEHLKVEGNIPDDELADAKINILCKAIDQDKIQSEK